MKIVFFGTPNFVNPVLDSLKKNFEVVGVVSNTNDIPAQELKSLNPDLFVVASYGKLISKELLEIPRYGSLNIHPSLLPKYRGPSPIQQAILNGDKVSGITIIKMDDQIDHGPILFQEEFKLSDQDTFDTLSKKMFQRSSEILASVIKNFVAGKIKPHGQNHVRALFCPSIKKEDGYIDLPAGRQELDPEKLDRMIRAYYPWPGVWTKWSLDPSSTSLTASAQDKNGKIVKFLPISSHPELDPKSAPFFIQMEGKKVTSLKDFLNGYPNFPITSLI